VSESLVDAFELTFVGMGVVFVFLIVLTILVTLLTRWFPEQDTPKRSTKKPASTSGQSAVIAAITAAVHRYRQ